MQRPSWDDYFMTITRQVSTRSTCLRRACGAVVVKDRRILATGYNGTPKGVRHCEDVGCLREQLGIASGTQHELCRGIHAEQNAVVQAALYGVEMGGATVYSTHQPCVLCAKILINAGVVEIVYGDAYPDPLSEQMLSEAGVILRRFEGDRGEPAQTP
jgi:dCMP deaminase